MRGSRKYVTAIIVFENLYGFSPSPPVQAVLLIKSPVASILPSDEDSG